MSANPYLNAYNVQKAQAANQNAIDETIDYKPELHNWIGPVTPNMLSDNGKFLTLGPLPPGIPSGIEAIIMLKALQELGKTPDGRKIIRDVAVQYLKTIGQIITELSQSSSAHVISCAINQYVACTIYQRLGLMSPHDATQTRAWLDHQTGEAMLTERAGFSLTALTTLVRTTTYDRGTGEASGIAGLAAAAKILGTP